MVGYSKGRKNDRKTQTQSTDFTDMHLHIAGRLRASGIE
jgi:hypothetical protein